MSFSVYLNSQNGTQVAGNVNQIQYNFDFRNTPAHDGGYKVYMSFASEQFPFSSPTTQFGVVRIQDLGIMDSYSPQPTFTTTRQNHVMGLIRGSVPQYASIQTIPSYTMTSNAVIPANSGTVGYTETTNTTVSTYVTTQLGIQTVDAKHSDNAPVYLQSKPMNNQFTVRLTFHDGALYTVLGTAHYGMTLTFEAIK